MNNFKKFLKIPNFKENRISNKTTNIKVKDEMDIKFNYFPKKEKFNN
jgi:hypothetical protein